MADALEALAFGLAAMSFIAPMIAFNAGKDHPPSLVIQMWEGARALAIVLAILATIKP